MLLLALSLIVGLILIASSCTVVWAETCTITETLASNTEGIDSNKRVVTHDAFNEGATLTGASTPAVSLPASFLLTLTSGAATISLRALTGTNGATIDGNGLKLQLIRIKNLGANVMTFTFGASNPYNVFGSTGILQVPVGGVAMLYGGNNLPAIDATHKNIDVAGTGSQTAEVTIVMG